MGTKYETESLSGYNTSPPLDDGTQSEANKVKYSTTKNKLSDPIKGQVANIDAKLVNVANVDPETHSENYITLAADHQKTMEVTNATTITLLAVASAPSGYTVTIKNAGTVDVTIDATNSETIDGSDDLIIIDPQESLVVQLNQAQDGYNTLSGKDSNVSATNITPAYTTVANDHLKTLEVTAIGTVTLMAVADAPLGYTVTIKNNSGGVVLVAAAEDIDNLSTDVTLISNQSSVFQVDQSGLEYITLGQTSQAISSVMEASSYAENLVKLIHPDQSKGLQDLQRQALYPVSYNQQWGGMGYGGLPDGTLGEVATCFIAPTSSANVADDVSQTYTANGFKVGQTTDLNSVWVKIYKVGNPANNLQLFIYDDSAGDPNALITNGTATAQSGKLHTDNTDGEWVKFVFPTNPNVTADTQYHIVMKSSGAVDASNHWSWMQGSDSHYPYGYRNYGNATPTWTSHTGRQLALIIEPVTTILQSGLSGFDGALHLYEGAPLDQSGSFYCSNKEFNHKRGMIHLAGTGWNADKTFYDSGLGSDSNRIVIRCNVSTGFAQVDLYENNETKHTVTGTTDITSGNHIISVGYRAEGDGSDFLKLYVDGASEGTEITSQTITLDRAFKDGHFSYGGFPLAPTWTQDLGMSVLPSAAGWTFTGTATEANAMVVDGGILYQNGAGYGSTQSGYYVKTTTLSNTTGWVVETKVKIKKSPNTPLVPSCALDIYDGVNRNQITMFEYYLQYNDGTTRHNIQIDLTKETTIKVISKGSDVYIYADGGLIFDGTGLALNASASNQILFGDLTSTAGENSTAQWHYLKYYEGAYLPEYSSMQLSEHCNWNDDKSNLLSTIYNAGSIQSVKTLAGMNENYVNTEKQVIEVNGITITPTTASTTFVPLDEMSLFCFGSKIKIQASSVISTSVTGALTYLAPVINGDISEPYNRFYESSAANDGAEVSVQRRATLYSGLNFASVVWQVSAGTGASIGETRTLDVESE